MIIYSYILLIYEILKLSLNIIWFGLDSHQDS